MGEGITRFPEVPQPKALGLRLRNCYMVQGFGFRAAFAGAKKGPRNPRDMGRFPKLGDTILGVPITRTIVFGGLYWGPPDFGKLPYTSSANG